MSTTRDDNSAEAFADSVLGMSSSSSSSSFPAPATVATTSSTDSNHDSSTRPSKKRKKYNPFNPGSGEVVDSSHNFEDDEEDDEAHEDEQPTPLLTLPGSAGDQTYSAVADAPSVAVAANITSTRTSFPFSTAPSTAPASLGRKQTYKAPTQPAPKKRKTESEIPSSNLSFKGYFSSAKAAGCAHLNSQLMTRVNAVLKAREKDPSLKKEGKQIKDDDKALKRLNDVFFIYQEEPNSGHCYCLKNSSMPSNPFDFKLPSESELKNNIEIAIWLLSGQKSASHYVAKLAAATSKTAPETISPNQTTSSNRAPMPPQVLIPDPDVVASTPVLLASEFARLISIPENARMFKMIDNYFQNTPNIKFQIPPNILSILCQSPGANYLAKLQKTYGYWIYRENNNFYCITESQYQACRQGCAVMNCVSLTNLEKNIENFKNCLAGTKALITQNGLYANVSSGALQVPSAPNPVSHVAYTNSGMTSSSSVMSNGYGATSTTPAAFFSQSQQLPTQPTVAAIMAAAMAANRASS